MSVNPDLPDWLAGAANGLVAGDVDAWIDLYSADAVHEFPFAGPGSLERVEGKGAIRELMTAMGQRIRFGSFSDVQWHQVGDTVVVEAEGHHVNTVSGEPFDVRYIWVFTFRNGEVVRLRDYTGPRRPAAGAR